MISRDLCTRMICGSHLKDVDMCSISLVWRERVYKQHVLSLKVQEEKDKREQLKVSFCSHGK